MEATFGWPAHPDRIAEIRKADLRFRDPYGFALVDGRTVAGFVGVADIPVRTRAGETEQALGIHHVATHPAYSRQGVAARLFAHVEDVYRGQGRRFSFLFTSRSFVAWQLYRKLGYEDLPTTELAPRALKLYPRGPRAIKPRYSKPDYRRVEKLHSKLTAGKCGFSVRHPGWLKALKKIWKPGPGFVVACRDGYALVEAFQGTLYIDEILCRNRKAYLRILARLLHRRPQVIVDLAVWDPVLLRIYTEKRFQFRRKSYGTLMAKPLAPGISVRSVFGPRFYWTPCDQF